MGHEGRASERGARLGVEPLVARALARLDRRILLGSAAPLRALAGLLAVTAAASALCAAAGVAAGDEALFFREGMPGTWLSVALLALIAYVALSVHAVEHPGRPWHAGFWGLAAAVFGVFAADEALGTSQLVGTWLNQGLGLSPAAGFNDVGSVLLTLLFAGAALVLAPRALVLLRRPLALVVLAAGAALGAASQALDSFVAPSPWEFVAEETLKLGAEAFLLAGFLAALRAALADGPTPASGEGGRAAS